MLALLVLLAAFLGTSVSRAASGTPWTYLAMGDSNVYGAPEDCGKCTPYPILLKRQIPAAAGVRVRLLNAAQRNKLTAARLLAEIKRDDWGGYSRLPANGPSPRAAIASADIITVSVGFNDVPWLAAVDTCHQAYGVACRTRVLRSYAVALDGILTEIDTLRAGKPTAVRVTTMFNDVIQGGFDNSSFYKPRVLKQALTGIHTFVEAMNAKICSLANKHGARCVDNYHIFNGPDGTRPMAVGYFTPKYGDLNQLGQDQIAAAVIKLGWAPLTLG